MLACASVCHAALPAATGQAYPLLGDSHFQLFVPSSFQPSSSVDLLVNFHGGHTVPRDNAKYAGLNALVLTIHYDGLSSAYQTPFSNDTTLFGRILDAGKAAARGNSSIPDDAEWNRIAVSSFSAGYAGVREVLKQPAYVNEIDALLLADSLYAGFVNYPSNLTLISSQMAGFRAFAQQAAAGTKTMVVAHSLVPTVTYADTKLCADDLAAAAAATFTSYNAMGMGGIHYYRKAEKGNLTILGATENTGDGHLLFVNNMAQWLDDLPIAHVPEPAAGAITLAFGLLLPITRRRRPV